MIGAKFIALFALLVIVGSGAFVYSGVYPVGADVPHLRITEAILETIRERSIAQASADVDVPDLDDPELLLSGGPDYNEMCTSCHLRPGKSESDMSVGLYPAPPDLTKQEDADDGEQADAAALARQEFWVIKHGIKASGMPAWGKTHDDERIWAMVAFLNKLPELTPEQYQILTARGQRAEGHH